MKNEIKEIFNKYGKSHYDDKYCLEFETYIIELQELKTLYDYITNLQKIEQQYSAILSENAELENKITNLQEEYEKEHYLVDKLTRQLNDEYKNTEYQCKQKEDYKSRNEKAIKMFNNENLNKYYYGMSYEFEINDFKEDMLNILQGSDKDE